ncbi:MAG: hypothetical protein HYX95_03775 [Chloroflexi bacterium]|nr:hypothetical protein [Chloroflexota bacterium]
MDAVGVLRIFHVIFGIFVAGTYLFMVLILEPRLKRLGPAVEGPLMSSLAPVLTPVMGVSFIMLLGTGIAMTLILRSGTLNTVFTTGWGWGVIIGLIATLGSVVVGFGMLTPTGIRLSKLGGSIKGRPPTPQEGQQMGQLSSRITTLTRWNFTLIMLATAAMIAARYL